MLARLRAAWRRSDQLFGLLRPSAWLAQPIPLRQPFVFYLGHLPAFAWNHLGRRGFGAPPIDAGFEALFERGIDPVDVDSYAASAAWPEVPDVMAYRDRVRDAITEGLDAASAAPDVEAVAAMVLEHELMHHETLLYMVQELEHEQKQRPPDWPVAEAGLGAAEAEEVAVPAGRIELGAPRDGRFAWDNEFAAHAVEVAAFAIDRRPVTNGEFAAFVSAGGYAQRRFWDDAGWAWIERQNRSHPHGWTLRGGEPGAVRGLLEDVAFASAASWPVAVSHAEATAYASWRGRRLPTEPEWRRAAHGSRQGQRPWPWGEAEPDATRANADFVRGGPGPAGALAAGESAWGVRGLVGDGWEWTSTPFAPYPGFAPDSGYPGYSADFFDGRHHVMLGGSWATDRRLLRASFRNWFQPHYPWVFSAFRCARDAR
jgi:ergothioneine biosynthesis protein EgtB